MADRKLIVQVAQDITQSAEEEGRLNFRLRVLAREQTDGKTLDFMDFSLGYQNVPADAVSDVSEALLLTFQELADEGLSAQEAPNGLVFEMSRDEFLVFEAILIDLAAELNDYGVDQAEAKGHGTAKIKARKNKGQGKGRKLGKKDK